MGNRFRFVVVLISAAVTASLASGIVVRNALADPNHGQSKGRIPQTAFHADGHIDRDKVPDFVVAYGRDGSEVGYVRKDDILPLQPRGPSEGATKVPVFDETLQRVVGAMVPGRGFVATGVNESDVAPFEAKQGRSAE